MMAISLMFMGNGWQYSAGHRLHPAADSDRMGDSLVKLYIPAKEAY